MPVQRKPQLEVSGDLAYLPILSTGLFKCAFKHTFNLDLHPIIIFFIWMIYKKS